MFVPGQHSPPSQISAGKARSLLQSGTPEGCFTWVGSGLAHITQGSKGLPPTNTLGYYKH